ncbi:MAG: hypothetical protein FWF76_02840, partial [Oscillospiraceae bacterium]|nr:hypothetical protein [Oscillospiraceae bacterium]
VGDLLAKAGYDVRVFNTIEMAYSNNYNPFHYVCDYEGQLSRGRAVQNFEARAVAGFMLSELIGILGKGEFIAIVFDRRGGIGGTNYITVTVGHLLPFRYRFNHQPRNTLKISYSPFEFF